jgi:hypothetical protein
VSKGKAVVRRAHEEWLDLLDRAGPFITLPIAVRIWPAGLDPLPKDETDEFRSEFDRWREDPAGGQRRWASAILKDFLGRG